MTKQNIISLVFLGLLVAGIPLATYLVRQQQILRSQAAVVDAIKFVRSVTLKNNKIVATEKIVGVEVTSPFESIKAKNPGVDLVAPNPFSPANPGDNAQVTVRFTKNTDTNFVKLVIDGSEENAVPSGTLASCPSTGCTIEWNSSHPLHTVGQHTLAVHPFYCEPADTARVNCIAGDPDEDQIQVGGGSEDPEDPSDPGGVSASCDSNGRATLRWPAVAGATNYTIRINKDPAAWAPQYTGTDTSTASSGDRAFEAGSNNSATVQLSSGTYLDWNVTPTVGGQARDNLKISGGAFSCSGGSAPAPSGPGVCTPGEWSPTYCGQCKGDGSGWNENTDFGSGSNTAQWCTCAAKYRPSTCQANSSCVAGNYCSGGGGAAVPTATPVPASSGPDIRSSGESCSQVAGGRVECRATSVGDTDRVDVYVNSFSGTAFTSISASSGVNSEPWPPPGMSGNGTGSFTMIFVAIDNQSGKHAVTKSTSLNYNAGSFIPDWLIEPFTPKPVFAQAVPFCNASCDEARPCPTNLTCWGGECRSPAVPNDPACPNVAPIPGTPTPTVAAGVTTPVSSAPTPTPAPLVPLRTKTDAPAGTKTTGFKLSEVDSDEAWSIASLNPYTPGQTNPADYEFRAQECLTIPCDAYPRGNRRVLVQFIGEKPDGTEYKEVWSADIILALKPVIESALCSVPATGTGTTVTVMGQHLGDEAGVLTFAGQTTTVPAGSWTNLQVTANSTQSITGAQNVVLNSADGFASESVLCGTGESLIDIRATLACRSADKALSVADIEIREDTPQGTVVAGSKKEKVPFNADGKPQYTPPTLIEGKAYKLILKAPNSLTKVVRFTASAGTSALEALNLPAGDIVPDNGDCQINQLDRSRLVSEWTAAKSSNKRSDLNGDGFTNAFDYSCMMSNFRKECDRP